MKEKIDNLKRTRNVLDQEIRELEKQEAREQQKKWDDHCRRVSFFSGPDDILFGEDAERAEYDIQKEKEREEYLEYKYKDSVFSYLDN